MMYGGIFARFHCICGWDNQMIGGMCRHSISNPPVRQIFLVRRIRTRIKIKPPNTIIITVFGGIFMNRYCKIRQ